MTFFLKYKVVD